MRRAVGFASCSSILLVCSVVCGGCAFFDSGDPPPGGDGRGGVGDACMDATYCRPSLACTAGTCQPTGMGTAGSSCQLTGDCAAGLYCSTGRTCTAAGTAAEGGRCSSTASCMGGLVCVVEGFSGHCARAGGGDLGDMCMRPEECLAGLSCLEQFGSYSCQSGQATPPGGGGAPLPPPIPGFWPGETCTDDMGPVRAYFDVPRGTTADGDFYRLPFPNDVRKTATGLDLSRHPHPGTALSVDIIDRYLRASETDLNGFSTNPTVFFRFSKPYNWSSVDAAVRIVDITPTSPSFGNTTSLSWLTTAGPITRYICPNWLAMRPPHGGPLRPRTTYAAIVASTLVPDAGGTYQRSADLDALLAATPPSDAALAPAYAAYAPLRAWLASSMTDPTTILNVAVFTTQDPEAMVPKLRDAVRAAPMPAVTDLTVCDGSRPSPCDDGTPERACSPMSTAFVEIHGHISLPIFQAGTAPYERPEDGGGIMTDAAGLPVVARTEQVCFAMTVPRGVAPPTEGFPVVLFAHGTGGAFTNAVRNGVAEALSTGDAGGMPVRAATFAIDMPQHGSRRGASTRGPDELFFNFLNPRAARDNVMQGSADLMASVRFLESYAADMAASPTGMPIDFDATRVVLFSHSQGSTHASLMLPYEPGVRAAILSGNGGDLTESLLHKTQPIDIAAAVPYALLDGYIDDMGRPRLSVGDFHPVLAIFQGYFDRVDPVNYARRLQTEPIMGAPGRHVFMTYGLGDTYSTPETMGAYANASSMAIIGPVYERWEMPGVMVPVSGNVTIGMNMFTLGVRQYRPNPGDDGHFVAFQTDLGRADTSRFALYSLSGQIPPIGAP